MQSCSGGALLVGSEFLSLLKPLQMRAPEGSPSWCPDRGGLGHGRGHLWGQRRLLPLRKPRGSLGGAELPSCQGG